MPRARGTTASAASNDGADSALALSGSDAAPAASTTVAAAAAPASAASLVPAEAAGMTPKLQNIVCTVTLGCPLDLKRITLHARNAEYNPKRCAHARLCARAGSVAMTAHIAEGCFHATGLPP